MLLKNLSSFRVFTDGRQLLLSALGQTLRLLRFRCRRLRRYLLCSDQRSPRLYHHFFGLRKLRLKIFLSRIPMRLRGLLFACLEMR